MRFGDRHGIPGGWKVAGMSLIREEADSKRRIKDIVAGPS